MHNVLTPIPEVVGKLGGYNFAFGRCEICGVKIQLSCYWVGIEAEKHKDAKGIATCFHSGIDKPLCGPRCALDWVIQQEKETENG